MNYLAIVRIALIFLLKFFPLQLLGIQLAIMLVIATEATKPEGQTSTDKGA